LRLSRWELLRLSHWELLTLNSLPPAAFGGLRGAGDSEV